jgi:chromosome segregation ATPase
MSEEQTNDNNTNNVSITQEDYDALKAELEAEKARAQEAVTAATGPLNERIASLEDEVNTRMQDIETLKAQVAEKETGFTSLQAQHDGAITAYRDLVIKANPLVPTDLVQGSSIEEINASLEKATTLVGQIRQGIEQASQQQESNNSVPAGAPARGSEDFSAMTTREKITHGLQSRNK